MKYVVAILMAISAFASPGGEASDETLSFPSGEKMAAHDFAGVVRQASCYEFDYAADDLRVIDITLDDVDMLDGWPTIDWKIDVSLPSGISVRYLGSMYQWAEMEEYVSATGGVTAIRREIGHYPNWASWMDVRKVDRIRITIPLDSWKPKSRKLKIWISDIRLEREDSWKGTDRDVRYRRWLGYLDGYQPDISDSSELLEPPKEGRLGKPLKLVENRVPCAEIVAPRDRYGSLALAARELQHWIEKITGATLPVVSESTGTKPVRIFLNATNALERWSDDVEWLKGGADVDGYFVHTDGNDVHIGCCVPSAAGAADMPALGLPRDACPVGVFRGVIAFLENNSTILFAGLDPEIGTVYDESPDFTAVWGEGRSRPSTRCRGWFAGNETGNDSEIELTSHTMWIARTGGNARMPHRLSGHAYGVGEMIEYVPDEDPYRVLDGKTRIPLGYFNGQICLGATNVLELCVSNALAEIDRCDAAGFPLVSIGFFNEDNWRVCTCEKCTQPIVGDDGTILYSNGKTDPASMDEEEMTYRSTQYMQFVNRLADAVAELRPGIRTDILAYLFQRTPPKCRISSNVGWLYCPLYYRWDYGDPVCHPNNHHVFDEIAELQTKGGTLCSYGYQAFYGIDDTSFMAEVSAEDYRWFTDRGGSLLGAEFDAETCLPSRPGAMLNAWLFNRVGWDADLGKVERLRRYYLRRLYREGAPAAELYYARRRCDAAHRPTPGLDADDPEFTGIEARRLFGRYRDRITNPMAKRYYEQLERSAAGDEPLTIHVPGDCATFGEAVTIAAAGDTIAVTGGCYEVSVYTNLTAPVERVLKFPAPDLQYEISVMGD